MRTSMDLWPGFGLGERLHESTTSVDPSRNGILANPTRSIRPSPKSPLSGGIQTATADVSSVAQTSPLRNPYCSGRLMNQAPQRRAFPRLGPRSEAADRRTNVSPKVAAAASASRRWIRVLVSSEVTCVISRPPGSARLSGAS